MFTDSLFCSFLCFKAVKTRYTTTDNLFFCLVSLCKSLLKILGFSFFFNPQLNFYWMQRSCTLQIMIFDPYDFLLIQCEMKAQEFITFGSHQNASRILMACSSSSCLTDAT